MSLDLVRSSELFLIPSSFLVAALGTADTNYHRAAVSVVGLIVSLLWLVCSQEAGKEVAATDPSVRGTWRYRVLSWFAVIFIAGWFFSLVVHLWLAGQPLGRN